jgi:hypothetical protein
MHVDHLDSLKGCSAGRRTPITRSSACPLDLSKVVGAILFLIKLGDTILPQRGLRRGRGGRVVRELKQQPDWH